VVGGFGGERELEVYDPAAATGGDELLEERDTGPALFKTKTPELFYVAGAQRVDANIAPFEIKDPAAGE
jgi:hypothetical protein